MRPVPKAGCGVRRVQPQQPDRLPRGTPLTLSPAPSHSALPPHLWHPANIMGDKRHLNVVLFIFFVVVVMRLSIF